MSPPLTFTFSPQRTIRALRRCTGKWWLNELGGSLQHDQCFGTMRTIGRLRELGVSSSRWRGDEPEPRFPEAPVCTLLVVAGSSTCSGSHAGCAHGMCMVGSAVVAYFAHLARISRVRVVPLRSGGARESRAPPDRGAIMRTRLIRAMCAE